MTTTEVAALSTEFVPGSEAEVRDELLHKDPTI